MISSWSNPILTKRPHPWAAYYGTATTTTMTLRSRKPPPHDLVPEPDSGVRTFLGAGNELLGGPRAAQVPEAVRSLADQFGRVEVDDPVRVITGSPALEEVLGLAQRT
jgi:hypothetical protein